jgi:arsenate reductase (thioredoxin)
MKILILCTGNSCRSQMAHGFLESFDKRLQVFSAGTKPAENVNTMAVDVMKRAGIDISDHTPKHVDAFINDHWDYVITVCDHANETCPVFPGKVRHRLHMGFDDPSAATGSYIEILNEFYRVRNEIRDEFYKLYESELKKKL